MEQQIKEIVETVIGYIERMKKHLPDIIKAYRKDDIQEAADQMIDLSDGLIWLEEALRHIPAVEEMSHAELKRIYREFIEAFEYKDYLLLADLLEYELIPMVEKLQTSLYKVLSNSAN